ncbi:MAG: GYD domain-containing protein [Chloroflexi bacterium]|nr:GYD domain-containing protein [Chloroflexota bacterium]
MPRYLLGLSASADTWAAMIKDPSNRLEANRPVIESIGGKLEGYYFVVGENEIVELVDMPDDVSMEAITMAILASGAAKSVKTSTLLTAEEAMEAMRRAGDVGYRPPA